MLPSPRHLGSHDGRVPCENGGASPRRWADMRLTAAVNHADRWDIAGVYAVGRRVLPSPGHLGSHDGRVPCENGEASPRRWADIRGAPR